MRHETAEILRADTSTKTDYYHSFVSSSHVHRVVGRQNPGDVAAGFFSLPKVDDFMSEHTLISVKENIHNCQNFLKKAFLTTMQQDGAKKGEAKKAVLFESYFKITSPGRTAFSIATLSKKLQGQLLSFAVSSLRNN